MGKNYDEAKVVKILNNNPSLRVNSHNKVIEVLVGGDTVGNGSWGKIDFLVNYCGYVVIKTTKLMKVTKQRIEQDNGINMASMVRNIFKGNKNELQL